MAKNTIIRYSANAVKNINFDSPDRIDWVSIIHTCQTGLPKARKKNGIPASIAITLSETITVSKFDPFHIVLLSCLIESIKQKGYVIWIKILNEELANFIHSDMSFTQYWKGPKADHLDSPDPSRLNLWRTVQGRDEEYRMSVGNYFSNKYPGTDFFMLNNCLSELYFNIFDHAEANGVSFSYIHCDDEDVIHIAICDFGKGIASTMRRAFPDIKDDAEALAKALEKGVSAKTKDHNAGFGFDNVISCLEDGAKLRIISNNAFLMSSKKEGKVETIARMFPFHFKGSLIYFDLPISSFGQTEVSDEFTF